MRENTHRGNYGSICVTGCWKRQHRVWCRVALEKTPTTGVCSALDAARRPGETATADPGQGRSGVRPNCDLAKQPQGPASARMDGWWVAFVVWMSSEWLSPLRHDYRAGPVWPSICQGPAWPCLMPLMPWLSDVLTVAVGGGGGQKNTTAPLLVSDQLSPARGCSSPSQD